MLGRCGEWALLVEAFEMFDVLDVMCRVLLCMLEAVEGELCLREVLEAMCCVLLRLLVLDVLEMPEVMCCVLLCCWRWRR